MFVEEKQVVGFIAGFINKGLEIIEVSRKLNYFWGSLPPNPMNFSLIIRLTPAKPVGYK